jgi:hypothetical protein
VWCRYRRMRGFNVLHPMGYDAFGLPAEQYAIQTGTHPRISTERNIANIRRQIKRLGFSYDWDREIATTDPAYVKWTQWIFLSWCCTIRGSMPMTSGSIRTVADEAAADGQSRSCRFPTMCARRATRRSGITRTDFGWLSRPRRP